MQTSSLPHTAGKVLSCGRLTPTRHRKSKLHLRALNHARNFVAAAALLISPEIFAFEVSGETALNVQNEIEATEPSTYESQLEEYLGRQFPSKIERIEVTDNSIQVLVSSSNSQVVADNDSTGKSPSPDKRYLIAIPMHLTIASTPDGLESVPIDFGTKDSTLVSVPRFQDAGSSSTSKVDKSLYRFAVAVQDADGVLRWDSHGRYADSFPSARPNLPEAKPASKKGLGAWTHNRAPGLENEIQDLNISAVTVNLIGITHFLSLTPTDGSQPYYWQGKTYHLDERKLQWYDRIFRSAAKQNVVVSAVLLIQNGGKSDSAEVKLLSHPDATLDGHYAMPNVLDEQGLNYYSALLNLMTERWSREDGKFGRVHHWILHNEVDFGWVWTNAGKKSAVEYMDMYHRSMRLTHLLARRYDPNSQSFISLTHLWTIKGEPYAYSSKRMMDLLLQFCKAEGDFEWGLAHHPYPQDLFEPRTWEDDQSTFSLNTEKITPKNLEVLDAYMHSPELLFQGKVRKVHLSENGFNSRDYSDKSLEDQAAGMALAWHKVKNLSSIEIWHYHNWVDHPDEGGLRIGLRKFPKDPKDPLGKKPIWYLYKSLDTPSEEQVAAPYLRTIGIERWSDVDSPVTDKQ